MQRLSAATLILWLLLSMLYASVFAQSPEQARLYLQALPVQDETLLLVEVLVENAVDLYSAEVQLRYNPTQLAVEDANPNLAFVQIKPGSLFVEADRFIALNQVNVEAGLITYTVTLLSPAPAAANEGALATIVFDILTTGPYSVEVVNAQLVSSDLAPLPLLAENFYLSNQLNIFFLSCGTKRRIQSS